MKRRARRIFVGLLRTAAETVGAARKLVRDNASVYSRLGELQKELEFHADAFEGGNHAEA